jgi:hypothetical protein
LNLLQYRKLKKKRTRKIKKEVGGAILGLADIETDPRPNEPAPAPLVKQGPKASKSKLDDPVKIEDGGLVTGGSKPKRVNKYAELVKEVMKKQGFKKLADASKYIKENDLYTKK